MTRVQEVRKKFEEPKSSSEVLIFLKKPLWYWPLDFLISFFFFFFYFLKACGNVHKITSDCNISRSI